MPPYALVMPTQDILTDTLPPVHDPQAKVLTELQEDLHNVWAINDDDYDTWSEKCITFINLCHLRSANTHGDQDFELKVADKAVKSFRLLAYYALKHFKPDNNVSDFEDFSFNKFPLNAANGDSTRPKPTNTGNVVAMRIYMIASLLDKLHNNPSISNLHLISFILQLCHGKAWTSTSTSSSSSSSPSLSFPSVPGHDGSSWKKLMEERVWAVLEAAGKIVAMRWWGVGFQVWGKWFLFSDGRRGFEEKMWVREIVGRARAMGFRGDAEETTLRVVWYGEVGDFGNGIDNDGDDDDDDEDEDEEESEEDEDEGEDDEAVNSGEEDDCAIESEPEDEIL